MRDDLLVAGEVNEAEPPPLAALANLQGDEAGDSEFLLLLRQQFRDALDGCRFADARPPSQ